MAKVKDETTRLQSIEAQWPHWLVLNRLPGMGGHRLTSWGGPRGNVSDLFKGHQPMGPLAQWIASKPPQRRLDWQGVEADLNWAQCKGHHILVQSDPRYPEALKQIASPPLVLFVKGDPHVLTKPQLAFVGSRTPSRQGVANAFHFAKGASGIGWVVTSGLALGIDAASHHGALKAGGPTIGVLGCGLDRVYPRENQNLAQEIPQMGALVSEFPIGALPLRIHFPRRNRILSGLSHGVLVVEAALRSGSLITAKYALEQGKEIFAIPGSIHHALSKGCHALIKQGAKLVENLTDISEEFLGVNLSHMA